MSFVALPRRSRAERAQSEVTRAEATRADVSRAESPRPVATSGFIGREVNGGVYVDVDGAPIWQYVAGEPSGAATVLVHGLYGSAANWAAQVGDFVDSGLRVFLPERTGHGHSPDDDAPFSYDAAATQVIRYLETIVTTPAHLIGWSDSAAIVALVAARRPDLVHRMILVGQYFHGYKGFRDDFVLRIMERDPAALATLRQAYARFAPEGADHFDVVLDKSLAMVCSYTGLDQATLATITTPTLVVHGDRDAIRAEASITLADALPAGRVAVLPGTHILPIESPELFNPLVLSFLAADPPAHWRP